MARCVILGAAAKTEHYEMACYRGLIARAQMMGHTEVAQILQQNLQQDLGARHSRLNNWLNSSANRRLVR